jgi:hypothetical protein
MAKTVEKMRIISINERTLTPDEIIEKIKTGNRLSMLEFNDFKSYVTKQSRRGGDTYEYLYGFYKKARTLIESEGYGEATYVGTYADGSKTISKNKNKLIDKMRTY